MLILSRRLNQRIWIGDSIVITVVEVGSGRVRLGIDCPKEIVVDREEVGLRKANEKVRRS